MSIEDLTSVDTVTPQTETVTIGASGGVNESYADGASLTCLVQEVSSRERLDYAARGLDVDFVLYFSTEPSISNNRRLKLVTVGGAADGRICRVTGAYKEGRPGEALLWVVLVAFVPTRQEA